MYMLLVDADYLYNHLALSLVINLQHRELSGRLSADTDERLSIEQSLLMLILLKTMLTLPNGRQLWLHHSLFPCKTCIGNDRGGGSSVAAALGYANRHKTAANNRSSSVPFNPTDWIVGAGKFPCQVVGAGIRVFGRLSTRIARSRSDRLLGSPCPPDFGRSIALNALYGRDRSRSNSIYMSGLFFIETAEREEEVACRHCYPYAAHIKDLGDVECYFHMPEIAYSSVKYPRDVDVILLAFKLDGF
ncbi:hypothetical protein V8C35DRAFT_138939 [Trichoderma chlorosporum]